MGNTNLYSVREAAALLNMKEYAIRYAHKKGYIESIKEIMPTIRFTEEEIERFRIKRDSRKRNRYPKNIVLNFNQNENYKFLPTTSRIHKYFGDPDKFKGNSIFLIGDCGTIINASTMKECKPYQTGNGHLQVHINGFQPTVETLVGLVHCDNELNKKKFHHINGIKTDNRAINLVAVFDDEHGEAHRLMNLIDKATTPEAKAKAQKEYDEFIEKIKADNKEINKKDLRVIDHVDYPSDEKNRRYMFVTEKSYQKYLTTNNDMDLDIRAEYYG